MKVYTGGTSDGYLEVFCLKVPGANLDTEITYDENIFIEGTEEGGKFRLVLWKVASTVRYMCLCFPGI